MKFKINFNRFQIKFHLYTLLPKFLFTSRQLIAKFLERKMFVLIHYKMENFYYFSKFEIFIQIIKNCLTDSRFTEFGSPFAGEEQ